MINLKPKYSILEAKVKLEAYCAYQERCAFEISQKLRLWNMHFEDHDVLIADLISNNFLNEERFAEAYASGKFNIKKWGKSKIKMHLKGKHISDYSINKAIKSIDPGEYENTLEVLARKKWENLSGNHWEKMGKLKRFLQNKGYETEILNDLMQSYIKNNE
ncbi:MAG: regulatory protein RecX [Crocinitomicaceae bacterium]